MIRPNIGRNLTREKIEIDIDFDVIEKPRIAFLSASTGAGTTTIIQSFARFIAIALKKTPSVVEINDYINNVNGYPFDKIGIDKRFIARQFDSLTEAFEKKKLRNLKNIDEGVNWCLQIPGHPGDEEHKFSVLEKMQIINSVPGDLTLCDLTLSIDDGYDTDKDNENLLSNFDLLVLVIDPLPSKLLAAFSRLELLKKLEISGLPVIYLINKYNSGINARELKEYIKSKKVIEVPALEYKTIYRAEYSCKTLIDDKDGQQNLQEPFMRLIAEIKPIMENMM